MQNDKPSPLMLFDFSGPSEIEWTTINDVVMGGVSNSTFKILSDSTALFSGSVSLENNGGFASVRTVPQLHDLRDHQGIILRIKGDGKRYSFRIRTDPDFDGIAYRTDFKTEKDKWMEIILPFSDFEPVFRGRILRNVPPLEKDTIYQFGFLIADKQTGPFALQIDWIKSY
jgi:hypothetical protein